MIREIAQRLSETYPESSTVVVGGTLDDLSLMRIEQAFVSGPVASADLEASIQSYALDCLLLCESQPLFGHPSQLFAFKSGLPVAYFDWSNGHCKTHRSDLAIDPNASSGKIVDAIRRWMLKR